MPSVNALMFSSAFAFSASLAVIVSANFAISVSNDSTCAEAVLYVSTAFLAAFLNASFLLKFSLAVAKRTFASSEAAFASLNTSDAFLCSSVAVSNVSSI